MIKTLLSPVSHPEHCTELIKNIDMSAEVKSLINALGEQPADRPQLSATASLLNSTNIHTGTLTLFYNATGNISLKTPDAAPASAQLYSIPGRSVLFAINAQSYCVQLYTLNGDHLTPGAQVIVDADNPLFIDGAQTLYDSNPAGAGHTAFIGSVNFPDKAADIHVYQRASLQKIAWFAQDDSAARYLVSLELLEALDDPDAGKVAEELIYHYHPAVAWKAFQLIHRVDPQTARGYTAQLRKLEDPRIDGLLDLYQGETA